MVEFRVRVKVSFGVMVTHKFQTVNSVRLRLRLRLRLTLRFRVRRIYMRTVL